MTLSEFKAWFEGFCEGIDEAPSIPQWQKIKAKIAETETLIPLQVNRLDPNRFLVGGGAPGFPAGYPQNVAGTSGERLPERGNIIASRYGIPVSHETRVVDHVTGADLGCSD